MDDWRKLVRQKIEELSFRVLHRVFYTGFIEDVIEHQIIGMDAISAHLSFKACIACLSEHLAKYAPVPPAKEDRQENAKGEPEAFYAPAVKLATLLHRAGWKTWLRHNEPPFTPKYVLPTKIERLKQYGQAHLAITPFKELIAEAESKLLPGGPRR